MKKFIHIVLFVLICTFGLTINGETVNQKNQLLELDQTVSKAAAKKGILKAFYPYVTDESMLFPLNGHPLTGKAAVKTAMEKVEIQKLQWEPLLSRVSSAGDLGFTHGRLKRGEAFAYYFTIWRKTSGQWKLAVSQGLINLKSYSTVPIPEKYRIDHTKAKGVLKRVMDTELAFSLYSVTNGVAKAFYNFIADDGMALSASGPPNTKEVYKKALARPAGENVLKWKPIYSFVSNSADMAYNFGPYVFTSKTKEGKKQHSYGYFVTVWEKQADGKWKFLIDGGNTSPPQ